MSVDLTLRALPREGAPSLIRLLTGREIAHLLPTEFPTAKERRVDGLARLTDNRLLHLEFETDWKPETVWRLLEYYGLICSSYDEVCTQIVLLARTVRTQPWTELLTGPSIRFSVRIVPFAALDPAPLLASPVPADNVLALLCRTDDIRTRVRSILERLADLPDRERRDAVAQLLVLAGLRRAVPIIKEEFRSMPLVVDVSDNMLLRPYFDKFYADGLRLGKEEGRERLARALTVQLTKRFGDLPEAIHARISAADADRITAWLGRVLDANSVDEVLAV